VTARAAGARSLTWAAARRDAVAKPALQITALLLGVVVWQLVGEAKPRVVASFTTVLAAGVQLGHDGQLWQVLGRTLGEMAIGYVAALAVGIPLGVVMALNRPVERAADMYLGWLLAIPEIAMIPFFVVAFGVDLAAQVAVVVAFALPVVVKNTLAGLVGVDHSLLEMATSFELNRIQVITKVLLPGALPLIMVGARMGLSRALLGVIGAGFFVQLFGLGGLIYLSETTFNLGVMFFGILVVMILAMAVSVGLQWLDRRLTFWNKDAGSR
jgi:ABC-type nitrate/sulfonate/bicarbonate transport system permease component